MQLAAWLQAEGLAAVPGLQDALLEVASTVDELKQLTSEDVTALLDALPSEAAGQSAAAAMKIRALRDRLVAEYEAASIPLLEAELTQACEQLWVPALDAALPYRRRPPLHEVLFATPAEARRLQGLPIPGRPEPSVPLRPGWTEASSPWNAFS